MTPIRIYRDPWHGAIHAHRAPIGVAAGTARGWLDAPAKETPRGPEEAASAAALQDESFSG